MRIIVHDFAGHPFQVELSRALAHRGHDVLHLYCGKLVTPRGDLRSKASDSPTFNVEAVELRSTIDKYSLLKRKLQEHVYARSVVSRVRRFAPDIVLSGNAPLDAQASLSRWCRNNPAKFVFWVQDLIGVGAHRVLRKRFGFLGGAVGRYLCAIEKRVLRRSDHALLITEDFGPILGEWGVPPSRTSVIENWAPVDKISEGPQANSWSSSQGLAGKDVLLYAGTLGMKHNPELLLRLATELQSQKNVRVVVISEGPGATWLAERKTHLKTPNLVLLGFQPFEKFSEVLATGCLLITLLERDAGVFAVPSKVLSGLCAGRPQLLAVPGENLAARIVRRSGAGTTVEPEDAAGFVAAAKRLLADRRLAQEMGQKGRIYADRAFDIARITDDFEALFDGLIPSKRRRQLQTTRASSSGG